MLNKYISIVFFVVCLFIGNSLLAQADRDTSETTAKKIFVVTTNSGGEFIGVIISQNEKEVLIETKDRGRVSIPKYEVRELKELKDGELNSKGNYVGEQVFATRYFFTTNALPLEKGESYVLWNWFGPEIHFGAAKNLTLGCMTTWVGIPIVASLKYSIPLNENINIGAGAMLGTGSWAAPEFGFTLPYGALTIGNRKTNLNLSAGYGAAFYDGNQSGTALYSLAFMTKFSKKISFVFDSMFFTYNHEEDNGYYDNVTNTYIEKITIEKRFAGGFSPGIRIQIKHDSAFQFGFLGAFDQNQFAQVPFPMIGWFKKL
jgi:hypothetical protein